MDASGMFFSSLELQMQFPLVSSFLLPLLSSYFLIFVFDVNNHTSGIFPTRQNIVLTVNLDCKLNLIEITMKPRNADYSSRRFYAVTIRLKYPKTTGLILASEKVFCTGAKTKAQSKLEARKYARIVQILGFPVKFRGFKIHKIVSSCDVNFIIRLEGFEYSNVGKFYDDPEYFPNRMVFKMKQPDITVLISVSEKIVTTWAKERGDVYTGFEYIYPLLR
ncbi:TATA-box-binding protein 1-like [Papaver somniferum]|uniref:TATA-box-binding protein 1-like n=1 Tax=Papaver somniferum TaxID=3469 RepID=UPI000E6F9839|nr:TATA-box-binding protein 1-like [Papaver somniferum]